MKQVKKEPKVGSDSGELYRFAKFNRIFQFAQIARLKNGACRLFQQARPDIDLKKEKMPFSI